MGLTSYTVYCLKNKDQDQSADDYTGDDYQFIPEKFAIGALIFSFFWFLYHRAWYGAGTAFIAWLVVQALASMIGINDPRAGVLTLLLSIGLGLFGNDIRRWSLEQQGFEMVDIVNGKKLADAEAVFFRRAFPKKKSVTAATGEQAVPNLAKPAEA